MDIARRNFRGAKERFRERVDAEILQRTDVRETTFAVKEIDKSTSAEFAWREMHVRDEERSRVSCHSACVFAKKRIR